MRWLITAILLILAAPAQAASPAEQEQAERIFKAMPATTGVWAFEREGAALRHVQSGLRCRALYPEPRIELLYLSNGRSPAGSATDAGCDYGRIGNDGRIEIMLSVYAEKAGPDETLDRAFQRSRADLLAFYEDARPKGPFHMAESAIEERSESFETTVNKVRTRVSLTVSFVNGWIVEVRAASRGDTTSPSRKTAASMAWKAAVESIGAKT